DQKCGGLFTYTLSGLLSGKPEAVGADREGRLTWKGFFPVLRRATDSQFRRWLHEVGGSAAGVKETSQLPRAFALDATSGAPAAKDAPFAATATTAGASSGAAVPSTALVGIINRGRSELSFFYRRDNEKSWRRAALAPGR